MHKVPRQWLINVTYTLVGERFATWVKDEIANRNEAIAKKQKLLIELDSDIYDAFQSSANISSKFWSLQSIIQLIFLTPAV